MTNIVPRWEKATNELINKLENKGKFRPYGVDDKVKDEQ